MDMLTSQTKTEQWKEKTNRDNVKLVHLPALGNYSEYIRFMNKLKSNFK